MLDNKNKLGDLVFSEDESENYGSQGAEGEGEAEFDEPLNEELIEDLKMRGISIE